VRFCEQHTIGAPRNDGTPSSHLDWTGYYSTDSLEAVVKHYMRTLGPENHEREDGESIWRFPLTKPERVLTVTTPQGRPFPRDACKALPRGARAIVIISTMSRPD
jgi:hypothetical protein